MENNEKRKVIFEWGHQSLITFLESNKHVDSIHSFNDYYGEKYNVDFEIIPYLSVNSYFSGGRGSVRNKPKSPDFEDCRTLICDYNKNNISVNLVLNGGLTFQYDKICKSELNYTYEIFNYLASCNSEYEVNNCVTLLNSQLNDYIKSTKLNLQTVSSCIAQVDDRNKNSFSDFFHSYDYVVPLNQQSTALFLEKYKKYADQMVLFIYLSCFDTDIFTCYKHYCELDARSSKSIVAGKIQSQSKIWEKQINKTRIPEGQIEKPLNERIEELKRLMSWGVNKLKIPWNNTVDVEGFHLFMDGVFC